jgi:hypothetical protein
VIEATVITLRWLGLGLRFTPGQDRPSPRDDLTLRVACPHCTNVDTLSRHCASTGCHWVSCTCGALVYSRRRHRHPRHGSGRDTCHDPTAAA